MQGPCGRAVPRICLVVAGLVIGLGCAEEATVATKEERPVPVRVEPVGRRTLRTVVRYTGEVRPSAQVNVVPRMAERIVELGFDEGDLVTKDETVLARLDPQLVDTGVRQVRAGADALRAQIDGLRTEQERLRRLARAGASGTAELDGIDAQLRTLDAQRRQALAGLAQASLHADDAEVKAPMTGIVARRYVDVGDMAAPTLPIATIVQLDPAFVWVDVPSHELEVVRQEKVVTVRPEASPDEGLDAELDIVSPTVDRESRSVRIRYRVPNAALVLRDGMLVTLEVELARRDDVLAVPLSALSVGLADDGGGVAYAGYVVDGVRARRVAVRTGLQEQGFAEVLSGLSEKDLLVTEGGHLLREGTAVEIVPAPGEPPPAPGVAATSAPSPRVGGAEP